MKQTKEKQDSYKCMPCIYIYTHTHTHTHALEQSEQQRKVLYYRKNKILVHKNKTNKKQKLQKNKNHSSNGFVQDLYTTERNSVSHLSGTIQITCTSMPNLKNRTSPNCAQMPLYYMVRYASSSVSFVCKQCTEKSA